MDLKELEDSLQESIEVYNNCTTGSEAREKEAQNVERIAKALTALKQQEADEADKEERRLIEKKKNDQNAEIESAKTKVPWARIGLEMLSQIAVKTFGHLFYKAELREVLHFEEHGIIRSKGGKDLRPPQH